MPEETVRMKMEFSPELGRALPHSLGTEELVRTACKLPGPPASCFSVTQLLSSPEAPHRVSLPFLAQRPRGVTHPGRHRKHVSD